MQTEKAATATQTFAANRAVGEVAVEVRAGGGVTQRGPVHEAGSLRVRFPSPEQQGLSVVLV
ncbi:MAG: urease accessory protein UreD, partial [Pseudomonadota bacterium]